MKAIMVDPHLSVSSPSLLILKYLLRQTKFSKAQVSEECLRYLKVNSLEGSNKQFQLTREMQIIFTVLHKAIFAAKWSYEHFCLQKSWHLRRQAFQAEHLALHWQSVKTNISEIRLPSPKEIHSQLTATQRKKYFSLEESVGL